MVSGCQQQSGRHAFLHGGLVNGVAAAVSAFVETSRWMEAFVEGYLCSLSAVASTKNGHEGHVGIVGVHTGTVPPHVPHGVAQSVLDGESRKVGMVDILGNLEFLVERDMDTESQQSTPAVPQELLDVGGGPHKAVQIVSRLNVVGRRNVLHQPMSRAQPQKGPESHLNRSLKDNSRVSRRFDAIHPQLV